MKKLVNRHLVEWKWLRYGQAFGGPLLLKSHAKSARPFSNSQWQRIIMFSQMAGQTGFFNRASNKIWIKHIVKCHRQNLKIRNILVQGSIVEFQVRGKSRQELVGLFRIISGLIARRGLKAEKGHPAKGNTSFWSYRPFSHLVKLRRFTKKYAIRHILRVVNFAYRKKNIERPNTS